MVSRDRVSRRGRGEVPELPPPDPEVTQTRRPLDRRGLSGVARPALTGSIAVDVEVCATGEPCAQAARCGRTAHVKVFVHEGEQRTRALCADHWLATREVYVAVSGGRVNYGPGAMNFIAMRRTPRPCGAGQAGRY